MLRLTMLGGLQLTGEEPLADGGPRRRRLALLAMVAAAGSRGLGRDRALAVLWPDSPPDQARHALSQTLYALRRDLNGLDLIDPGPDLRIVAGALDCDLDRFRAAVAARDLTLAATSYGGPFLDGFALPDAPGFERWVEEERRALARTAAEVFEQQARAATAIGRHSTAAAAWRRALELDPLASRAALGYLNALAANGDRAGALAFARQYTDDVRRELEIEPAPEIAAAAERLRVDSPRIPSAAPEPDPPAPILPPGAAEPAAARPVVRAAGWWVPVVVIVTLVVVGIVAMRSRQPRTPRGPPVMAVGQLRDLTAPDSSAVGGVLGEILTTSLGRLPSFEVIGTARMLELTPRDLPSEGRHRLDTARRAGADELLEGELSAAGPAGLRLDLRRIDVQSGLVRRGYRVLGADRWAVIDSVTVLIAADLALAAPVEALTTRSPIALRLYEDGLRALYQFDTYAAARTFREVVAEDSTFAMAAYYSWWTAALVGDTTVGRFRALALRLAASASTHDRLLIRTHIGSIDSDPASVPAADSLATLFPRDPDALIRAAEVMRSSAMPSERPVALLNRAIAIDSAAGGGRGGPCRLCEGFQVLSDVYLWADSLAERARTTERWRRMVPDDARAILVSAAELRDLGRDADADRAEMVAHRMLRTTPDPVQSDLHLGIRRSDPELIRRGCAAAFAVATSPDRWAGLRWSCVLGLRTLGRLRDGIALAADGRSPLGPERRAGPPDLLLEAVLDADAGRTGIAARYFLDRAARMAVADGPASVRARDQVWNLALAGTALAAGGDTLAARRLVDTVESLGRRSSYARDQRLHHFLRGLLLSAANQPREAVDHYRLAINSYPLGYTRINYALAGSLMATGRPAEAIYPLQAALRGGMEGPQLYQDRTQLHERLAQAFDQAGQPDSASAHYLIVARCWKDADPLLAGRRDVARDWLRRHGRPLP